MEVQGKIKVLRDTQTFGNNGFRKRELVIETEEQYPQVLMIEFVQDKCDVLNNYKIGQNVKIGINLRGREWVNPEGESKYFNTIQGWRIDSLSNNNTQPTKEEPKISDEEPDGLPF